MTEEERLDSLVRHIENVQENVKLLIDKLRGAGLYNEKFYRIILKKAYSHDNSKFNGIEWLYLHSDVKVDSPADFKSAAEHHVYSNNHHPEYWGGVEKMPPTSLAVLVCDWKSRSEEFGNDFLEWINAEATKQYNFSCKSKVYKLIMTFAGLLVEKSFK